MRSPDRIVLVDNDPASSAELRAALEAQSDLSLAAAVTCASCSFAAVSGQKPDLVLLSLSLPGYRVLELVRDLVALHAGLKFLIVSRHEEQLETARVLRAGAHGCVMTGSSIDTKLEAVREVLAGNQCFVSQIPLHPPAAARLSPSAASFHWATATAAL